MSPTFCLSAQEIRERFLSHFEALGHVRVPSSSLIPTNDPTLLFTNAGMVQFKDVFTGKEEPSYRRATSVQKCIRISGKHNDLEKVGYTARHHTFFEMLGNFSFGDYFKREAIEWAWAFVTGVLGVDPEQIVVTVFGGGEGLPPDEEAEGIWKKVVGIPDDRVFRLGVADNFWSMGDTGPCGPCTEIHCWIGNGPPVLSRFGEEPEADGQGWVEIWNLVFMQFERLSDGRLTPLPRPCVDTGAGLERLAALSQGVVSNYDTDLLRPLVDVASRLAKKPYCGSLAPDDVSMRVIADHARAAAFLISEGIFPDKEGRSHVLRRIIRRAVRHGHRLGIGEPFLHLVAEEVVRIMGAAYPQLIERAPLIAEMTCQEEERFRATLERGLELIANNQEWIERDGRRVLPGKIAFKLYDTFGFPIDLQEVIGREQGFVVDREGYENELLRAKEKSAGSKIGDRAIEDVYHLVAKEVGESTFIGYDTDRSEDEVVALIKEGAMVQALHAGEEGELVVHRTPFYPEGGGQVGDRGRIYSKEGTLVVFDTKRIPNGIIIHRGKVKEGKITMGARVCLEVDADHRQAVRRSHSATHLLHWALRHVLGPTAMQKGSLVAPDRVRFDYAAPRAPSSEELLRIETLVNQKIWLNAPVQTEILPIQEAKARGAIALFEEKYGEVVRMLRITDDSIELCGGTHAKSTGEVGLFKVVSEGGIAAGVRRIEALTGRAALEHIQAMEKELTGIGLLLKVKPEEVKERIERLFAQLKEQERSLAKLQERLAKGKEQDFRALVQERDGYKVLGAVVGLGEAKALRDLADRLRDELGPSVVLLGTRTTDGRALLACSVSKELTSRFVASDLVRQAAALLGGGGGGRPDFAQAGANQAERLEEAVALVYALTK
ncbi:MAG: alanine--tRNA ligase [Sandaracinaceae bacterium]|nr:alanine--tRNA ligase [Sandaracinaceae bacterium]